MHRSACALPDCRLGPAPIHSSADTHTGGVLRWWRRTFDTPAGGAAVAAATQVRGRRSSERKARALPIQLPPRVEQFYEPAAATLSPSLPGITPAAHHRSPGHEREAATPPQGEVLRLLESRPEDCQRRRQRRRQFRQAQGQSPQAPVIVPRADGDEEDLLCFCVTGVTVSDYVSGVLRLRTAHLMAGRDCAAAAEGRVVHDQWQQPRGPHRSSPTGPMEAVKEDEAARCVPPLPFTYEELSRPATLLSPQRRAERRWVALHERSTSAHLYGTPVAYVPHPPPAARRPSRAETPVVPSSYAASSLHDVGAPHTCQRPRHLAAPPGAITQEEEEEETVVLYAGRAQVQRSGLFRAAGDGVEVSTEEEREGGTPQTYTLAEGLPLRTASQSSSGHSLCAALCVCTAADQAAAVRLCNGRKEWRSRQGSEAIV